MIVKFQRPAGRAAWRAILPRAIIFLACLVCCTLSIATFSSAVHVHPDAAAPPKAPTPLSDCEAAGAMCSHLFEDLAWRNAKIKVDALSAFEEAAYEGYIARVAIVGGKVYLRRALPRPLNAERARLAAYLTDIVDTADEYPLGDSEFFVSMADNPFVNKRLTDAERRFPLATPVLTHSKNDDFADFLIPGFDYRCGNENSVDELYAWRFGPEGNDSVPWETRKPVAFGRWTMFCVNNHLAFPYRRDTPCPRSHLDHIEPGHDDLIDVGSTNTYDGSPPSVPKQPMPIRQQMDTYRYLVSTDGWSSTLKLEKYLLGGAAIMKQQSEARGYYYHALRPGVHYHPFYIDPDDAVDQAKWLREHDDAAQAMGAAAKAFGKKYFGRPMRRCYLRSLLNGVSEHMGFQPRCEVMGKADDAPEDAGNRTSTRCILARDFLVEVIEEAKARSCDVRLAHPA